MKNLDDSILTTLRGYFLLAAADLALYPEGSPEHIRAKHSAANTSRTVSELFGAAAAEALREEAVKKWPKLGGIDTQEDEEVGSFTFGKCNYCGREWGVTLEGAKGGGYPTQRTANAAATRVCDCPEAVENRKPEVGVAFAVTTGACKYCGQLQEVGPHPSQAAADETATEVCSCPSARTARRTAEQIEDARDRVNCLFGERAEDLGFKPIAGDGAIELLERVVELIARGPISSASLNIRGQCIQFETLDKRVEAAQFLTNIGALELDQVLEVFGFPPIGDEEGKRRVQTLNMVNAAIADKYQLESNGTKTETDPPPQKPQEPPSQAQQDPPEGEEGQEPADPKDGKEGA